MRLLIVLAVLFVSTSAFADNERRDGHWWISPNGVGQKNAYVLGMFDGMILGYYFSYWGKAPDGKSFVPAGADTDLVLKSYTTMYEKYLKNVTSTQIADGLNEFYKDFRNRRVLVRDAIWVVLNQIAGTSTEEVNSTIESMRREAK